MGHIASQSSPASSDVLSFASLDSLCCSIVANAAYCSVLLSKNHKTSRSTFIPEKKKVSEASSTPIFKSLQKVVCRGPPDQTNKALVIEATNIVATRFKNQRGTWTFQEIWHNRCFFKLRSKNKKWNRSERVINATPSTRQTNHTRVVWSFMNFCARSSREDVLYRQICSKHFTAKQKILLWQSWPVVILK